MQMQSTPSHWRIVSIKNAETSSDFRFIQSNLYGFNYTMAITFSLCVEAEDSSTSDDHIYLKVHGSFDIDDPALRQHPSAALDAETRGL